MLREDTPRAQVSVLASALSRAHGGTIEYLYTDVFKGFSVKKMSEHQAKMLSNHPMVTSVEENARIQVTGQQPFPGETGVIKPLDRIDQRNGLDALYNYPRTGTGVHVYIVDTGVWIHNTMSSADALMRSSILNLAPRLAVLPRAPTITAR
jgi:hypothetical protein